MTNPWALTPRECEVMDAMLARGTLKGAAKGLGIDAQTVNRHMMHARQKMRPPHKLGHFLMWHDWRKASQRPAGGLPAETIEEASA